MDLRLLIAVVGLGVAGFDPFGALLVAAALAMGASRAATLAFLIASSIVPLGLAIVAGQAVGPVEAKVRPWLHLPNSVWVAVCIVSGLVLIGWALWRARRTPEAKPPKSPSGVSVKAMTLAGLSFGVTVLLDPAYYAAIAVVARVQQPWLRVGLLIVWFVVAQIVLIGLVAVELIHPGVDLGGRMQRAWRRVSPIVSRVITVVALVAGTGLVIDGLWRLAHHGG